MQARADVISYIGKIDKLILQNNRLFTHPKKQEGTINRALQQATDRITFFWVFHMQAILLILTPTFCLPSWMSHKKFEH